MSIARFFDSRAAYMMFVTTTNEKAAVAERVGRELDHVSPGPTALRIFDAGMGDASVLVQLMRRMHDRFTHIPWLVVGKEISIEDVRLALDRLADRFAEHPELVVAVTNMYATESPTLTPRSGESATWREVALEGKSAYDLSKEIRSLYPTLAADWQVKTSPRTGNPLYVKPAVVVLYRKDREFLLKSVIPRQGGIEAAYDLILASQPYRARTSVERKARLVLVPLAGALAPGGRLVVVHSHGRDPGLEIVQGVWPGENPFMTDRHQLLAEAEKHISGTSVRFEPGDDDDAIFRYQLHAMPSEAQEHIGTSSIMAAWNAAAYVAQIDDERMRQAMDSGAYINATRAVIERHGRVWFNDEAYVISRSG